MCLYPCLSSFHSMLGMYFCTIKNHSGGQIITSLDIIVLSSLSNHFIGCKIIWFFWTQYCYVNSMLTQMLSKQRKIAAMSKDLKQKSCTVLCISCYSSSSHHSTKWVSDDKTWMKIGCRPYSATGQDASQGPNQFCPHRTEYDKCVTL